MKTWGSILVLLAGLAGAVKGQGNTLLAGRAAPCACKDVVRNAIYNDTYHLCSCAKTWDQAQQYCSATYTQGRLAPVFDISAQEFLLQALEKESFETSWIGGRAEKVDWHWERGGALFEQGCYKDDPYNRALDDEITVTPLTSDSCVTQCRNNGYTYAVLLDKTRCFCSQTYGPNGAGHSCTMTCQGDVEGRSCGGYSSYYVYHVTGLYSDPWERGQPALSTSNERDTRQCMALVCEDRGQDVWYWEARHCYETMKLICEYDLDIDGNCSSSTAKVQDKCIAMVDTQFEDWFTARWYCRQQGGRLFEMTDPGFLEFVQGRDCSPLAYWIGGSKFRWTWISGHEFSYTSWAFSAPSGEQAKQCLGVSNEGTDGYSWRDFECDEYRSFVCYVGPVVETTLSPTTTKGPTSTTTTTTTTTFSPITPSPSSSSSAAAAATTFLLSEKPSTTLVRETDTYGSTSSTEPMPTKMGGTTANGRMETQDGMANSKDYAISTSQHMASEGSTFNAVSVATVETTTEKKNQSPGGSSDITRFVTPAESAKSDDDDDLEIEFVIGVTLGVLAVAILLAIALYFFIARSRKKRKTRQHEVEPPLKEANTQPLSFDVAPKKKFDPESTFLYSKSERPDPYEIQSKMPGGEINVADNEAHFVQPERPSTIERKGGSSDLSRLKAHSKSGMQSGRITQKNSGVNGHATDSSREIDSGMTSNERSDNESSVVPPSEDTETTSRSGTSSSGISVGEIEGPGYIAGDFDKPSYVHPNDTNFDEDSYL